MVTNQQKIEQVELTPQPKELKETKKQSLTIVFIYATICTLIALITYIQTYGSVDILPNDNSDIPSQVAQTSYEPHN